MKRLGQTGEEADDDAKRSAKPAATADDDQGQGATALSPAESLDAALGGGTDRGEDTKANDAGHSVAVLGNDVEETAAEKEAATGDHTTTTTTTTTSVDKQHVLDDALSRARNEVKRLEAELALSAADGRDNNNNDDDDDDGEQHSSERAQISAVVNAGCTEWLTGSSASRSWAFGHLTRFFEQHALPYALTGGSALAAHRFGLLANPWASGIGVIMPVGAAAAIALLAEEGNRGGGGGGGGDGGGSLLQAELYEVVTGQDAGKRIVDILSSSSSSAVDGGGDDGGGGDGSSASKAVVFKDMSTGDCLFFQLWQGGLGWKFGVVAGCESGRSSSSAGGKRTRWTEDMPETWEKLVPGATIYLGGHKSCDSAKGTTRTAQEETECMAATVLFEAWFSKPYDEMVAGETLGTSAYAATWAKEADTVTLGGIRVRVLPAKARRAYLDSKFGSWEDVGVICGPRDHWAGKEAECGAEDASSPHKKSESEAEDPYGDVMKDLDALSLEELEERLEQVERRQRERMRVNQKQVAAVAAAAAGGASIAVGKEEEEGEEDEDKVRFSAFTDEVGKQKSRWIDLLRAVSEIFKQAEVDYMIFGGTVLSYCRHDRSLNPFDTDIDILVRASDLDKGIAALRASGKLGVVSDRDGGAHSEHLGTVNKVFFKSDPKAGSYGWGYPFVDLWKYELRWDKTGRGKDRTTVKGRPCKSWFFLYGEWHDDCLPHSDGVHEWCMVDGSSRAWDYCAPRKADASAEETPAGALPASKKELDRQGGAAQWPGVQVIITQMANHEGWAYPAELMLPTVEVSLEGVTMRGPKEPAAYLDWEYGKDWRTVCKVSNYDHEHEKFKPPFARGALTEAQCADVKKAKPGLGAWTIGEETGKHCPVRVLPQPDDVDGADSDSGDDKKKAKKKRVRVCEPGDQELLDRSKRMLAGFAALAEKIGLDYWLTYGSALGQAVWGGQIPYDTDIDVSIVLHDTPKLERASLDKDLLASVDVVEVRVHPSWNKPWQKRQYWPGRGVDFVAPIARLYDAGGKWIDIWGEPTHTDMPDVVPRGHIAMQFESYEYIPRPIDWVLPTRPCDFDGIKTRCQAQQALQLRFEYGVNWQHPYKTCDPATSKWVSDTRNHHATSKWW
eukprot:g805.t1